MSTGENPGKRFRTIETILTGNKDKHSTASLGLARSTETERPTAQHCVSDARWCQLAPAPLLVARRENAATVLAPGAHPSFQTYLANFLSSEGKNVAKHYLYTIYPHSRTNNQSKQRTCEYDFPKNATTENAATEIPEAQSARWH